MNFEKILENVENYFNEKIIKYGVTPRGVDWNSSEAQNIRFTQLIKICDRAKSFSINHYGCGYGALVNFLTDKGYVFRYRGFDISEQMIAKAKELHRGMDCCEFTANEQSLIAADYTVASGIFNVKLDMDQQEWQEYVLYILNKIAKVSIKGFAFNMLTKYSDLDRMRPDLYYADPCFFFDYCKSRFSKNVALLHDYDLYDFTIHVRS
jgi:hypothetical protein